MRARPTFLARLKNGSFTSVQFSKQGRPIGVKDVAYYGIRFNENGKRTVHKLGAHLDTAWVAFQNDPAYITSLNRDRTRQGLPLIQHDAQALVSDFRKHAGNGRTTITQAVEDFLGKTKDRIRMGELSEDTLRCYANAATDFRDNCGVTYVDEIDRKTLLRYKTWVFDNLAKRTCGKREDNSYLEKRAWTIANRFRNLGVFLRENGIQMVETKTSPGLLKRNEAPRPPKAKDPKKYTVEDVNALLDAASVDEGDYIKFFLQTGFRDGETAHAEWTDIDWRASTIHLESKPHWNWRIKDKEERIIDLDPKFLARMKARRERYKDAVLIFANPVGRPDKHLIENLYKAVQRAIDQGHRFSFGGVQDLRGEHAQHRFRKTFASMMVAQSDLRTVQKLLGHSHISTTERYLAPDAEKSKRAARTAFSNIGD